MSCMLRKRLTHTHTYTHLLLSYKNKQLLVLQSTANSQFSRKKNEFLPSAPQLNALIKRCYHCRLTCKPESCSSIPSSLSYILIHYCLSCSGWPRKKLSCLENALIESIPCAKCFGKSLLIREIRSFLQTYFVSVENKAWERIATHHTF